MTSFGVSQSETSKLYITLTTSEHNHEFFLKNEIDKKYSKVCLKSIYIQHENDANKLFVFSEKVTKKPIFVHCSLLKKDYILINGEPNDVIEILYPDIVKIQKNISMKLCSNSCKLIMHSNLIRMSLTSYENEPIENKGKCLIFYELEFS